MTGWTECQSLVPVRAATTTTTAAAGGDGVPGVVGVVRVREHGGLHGLPPFFVARRPQAGLGVALGRAAPVGKRDQ